MIDLPIWAWVLIIVSFCLLMAGCQGHFPMGFN